MNNLEGDKAQIFYKEHIVFLKKLHKKQKIILFFQTSIFLIFLFLWEFLARINILDSFLVSSPSAILETIYTLFKNNQLFDNIFITFFETLITFLIGSLVGIIISAIFWWFDVLEQILRPYMMILNALPKVALAPLLIVCFGAGVKSIIIISLLISVVGTIISITDSFKKVDKNKILLMKTFGANKFQILKIIVLPMNISHIMSQLKINIGMSLIGVITGEFLVSKKGIGHLIVYGSQVFKLNLIISGIVILSFLTLIIYFIINKIEKYIMRIVYKG